MHKIWNEQLRYEGSTHGLRCKSPEKKNSNSCTGIGDQVHAAQGDLRELSRKRFEEDLSILLPCQIASKAWILKLLVRLTF
jgi:hypothetical protein